MQMQLLPKPLFLENLRRERLRSDRSNSTLSVIVIHVRDVESVFCGRLHAFLQRLRIIVRETDSIGYLDAYVLGLLLPGTTEEGAQVVVDRIVNISSTPSVSVIAHTYPNELFENLQAQTGNTDESSALLFHDSNGVRPLKSVLKRGLDILGALTGLSLLSPFLLITAAAVKLTSPGPVIFRQIRLGKDFTPFVFYKFRSMRNGADDRIHREYVAKLIAGNQARGSNGESAKPLNKMTSDHRVTRIGAIIRKTSIDELPQLVNVLKGEMSLVGPRPPLPYETDNYQPWHLRRILEIKPGITGLWQVRGRSETSFDDMVRLDLQYCRNWSILGDLKIIFKTIRVVLQCRGAV